MSDDDFDWFDDAIKREQAQPSPTPVVETPKDRGPPPPGRRWNEKGQPVFDGTVYNPGKGRKGSRNKLATQFFHDLHALWEEQGAAVLRRAAFEEPVAFAAIVAKLMPQKIEVSDTTLQDLDSDKRLDLLEAIRDRLERLDGGTTARVAGRVKEGSGDNGKAGAVEILPPLSKTA